MSILFFLLLLVVVLAISGGIIAGLAAVVWYAVVGLIIGAVARLLVKGTRGYGIFATILSGIVGAIGGGLIAHALDLGGLLEFVVAVLLAAVVISITTGSSRGHRAIS
jgi:uncharacterized membrane protein YeaQ/YmgE (transglycosylase-associated protein family)